MLSAADGPSPTTSNKAVNIESGGNAVDFVYGADGNRVVQSIAAGQSAARTVYVGLGGTGKSLYERTTRGTTVEHTHFIYAGGAHGGNAFAVRIVTGRRRADHQYYHFDHLGSVTAISDEQGHVDPRRRAAPRPPRATMPGARAAPPSAGRRPRVFDRPPATASSPATRRSPASASST